MFVCIFLVRKTGTKYAQVEHSKSKVEAGDCLRNEIKRRWQSVAGDKQNMDAMLLMALNCSGRPSGSRFSELLGHIYELK